jgi:type IV secretion system protein VirB6
MFTWVGAQFNSILDTYVLGVVSTLMAAIAPIALTSLTLWVALYGWAVLRNEVSETVPTFMWKVFKISLVLAFALQSGFYISNVAETANALATGVATTFLPPATDPMTITSPYALLDAFNDRASQLVLDLLKEAGITRLDLVLAAVVCSIGNVIFLCIALFVVTLAKLFLTFAIAIGPLFILCLAWRPTARSRADLVCLLRAWAEHLHGRGSGSGHPGQRWLQRPHLQRRRRKPQVLRRDDPHGHHLFSSS